MQSGGATVMPETTIVEMLNNSQYISFFLSCGGTVALLKCKLRDLKLALLCTSIILPVLESIELPANLWQFVVIFYLSLLMHVYSVFRRNSIQVVL